MARLGGISQPFMTSTSSALAGHRSRGCGVTYIFPRTRFYYAASGGDWGLVSPPVFKTGEAGDPRLAGSIPVRLRYELTSHNALASWRGSGHRGRDQPSC